MSLIIIRGVGEREGRRGGGGRGRGRGRGGGGERRKNKVELITIKDKLVETMKKSLRVVIIANTP
jgi:hypothetical protein